MRRPRGLSLYRFPDQSTGRAGGSIRSCPAESPRGGWSVREAPGTLLQVSFRLVVESTESSPGPKLLQPIVRLRSTGGVSRSATLRASPLYLCSGR